MMAQTTRFKKTMVARALMLAFSTAAITGAITTTALAQSNATGNVYGQAPAGSSVVIENVGTGVKRTITADATGRFQATSLPIGTYRVQLVRGSAVAETQQVDVLLGQGSEVKFGGSTLQSVQIVSRRPTIDVSNTNNGSVFTSKELDALPMGRSVDAIVQLAPGTSRADPRYANSAASFGGGAPSENSYYINGFPVTNPLNQLGSSQLPFGAIENAQVLTGGFGAEFGRSIGGVVNITTKSGTNEWKGGVQYSISPKNLRADYPNIYYPLTGAAANVTTDGALYRRREENRFEDQQLGVYVGGPIIKDKLFMFVAAEQTVGKFSGVNPGLSTTNIASGDVGKWGWSEQKDTTTRYLGKIDWNLTDSHHLELTLIGDRSKRHEDLSGYNYNSNARDGVVRFSADYLNSGATSVGMDDKIIKYTGFITDDLTVTALYGEGKSPKSNTFTSSTGGFTPGLVLSTTTAAAPGITYNNPNALAGTNLNAPTSEDRVKAGRFDLEYKLGRHTIRAGLDEVKLRSINAGDQTAGGSTLSYRFTTKPGTKVCGVAGCVAPATAVTTLGPMGYYGRQRTFTDITNADSDQSAQYIEDRFQLNKDLLLTFGLRNESFKNKNSFGETFLEQKNVVSPRIAAAWDVMGDSTFKVFGSAGRYSVQIPTHIAVRGAGPSTLTDQFFTYSGVDAAGQPTGRVNISPVFSSNNELGQPKDAKTLSSTNLKPNQQDEITLGFEKALNPELTVGARVTHRKLVNTIDDFCDQDPIDAFAAKNNIDATNYGGFNCASINPGRTNILLVDFAGNKTYTPVTLTSADMGFKEGPKRTYTAIDLFVEHPLRNGWYGRVNYTHARSRGNTEGQTLSDLGQTDVAATQTWDVGGVMDFANGPLPAERKHQIKAYGYYTLSSEWTIGANAFIASGRPKNCLGYNPDPAFAAYSSSYFTHYCFGVPAPRGDRGTLPWDQKLDMNIVYKPAYVKGLSLRMDVFNLFNKQHVEAIDEVSIISLAANQPISPRYGRVLAYSAPRSVRLTARYDF